MSNANGGQQSTNRCNAIRDIHSGVIDSELPNNR